MNGYASPDGHQQSESISQRWLRSNHYQEKISMHLMCIILNSTVKWAGPYTGICRSMETPPELVVLYENIVNNSTSQCQGPTVHWSVLQGKGHFPPWSCRVNSPDPLLCLLPPIEARTGTQWLLYLHFVQRLMNLRYILYSATLGLK